MAVKIKVQANLGWLDAQKHGLDESVVDKVKEGKVLSVSDQEAEVLCNRVRCATYVNQPEAAT